MRGQIMSRIAYLLAFISVLVTPARGSSIDAFIGTWTGQISGIPVALTIAESIVAPEATATFNHGPAETLRYLGYKDAIPGLYFWREADKAAVCLFIERKGLWMAYFERDSVRKVALHRSTTALAPTRSAAAKPATSCTIISECRSFSDVYRSDEIFRDGLSRALRSAQIAKPSWLASGLGFSMVPLLINGHEYLIGGACEPHNCPHQINVLYSAKSQRLVGHYAPDVGAERWFGAPTARERELINAQRDAGSSLRARMEQGSLPVIIE
jgi:hypothetical protein